MFWVIVLLLFALPLCGDAVLSAAWDGAVTWAARVVPALLPHLILTGLAMRARPRFPRLWRLHPYALSALLLGALGGYPIGAKLIGDGMKDGALSERQALRLACAVSLPGPGFLFSVVALGLFARADAMLPIALSVYLPALLLLFLFGRGDAGRTAPTEGRRLSAGDAADAIADGTMAILRIGGCIVLCRALSALPESFGVPAAIASILRVPREAVSMLFSGLLELSCGCEAASALPLLLAARLALCVFFAVFGGASVLLQTRCVLPVRHFGRYVLLRAAVAVASALLCYALSLLLPIKTAEAIASKDEALGRLGALASVLIPVGIGVLSAGLFAVWALPSAQKSDDKRAAV